MYYVYNLTNGIDLNSIYITYVSFAHAAAVVALPGPLHTTTTYATIFRTGDARST